MMLAAGCRYTRANARAKTKLQRLNASNTMHDTHEDHARASRTCNPQHVLSGMFEINAHRSLRVTISFPPPATPERNVGLVSRRAALQRCAFFSQRPGRPSTDRFNIDCGGATGAENPQRLCEVRFFRTHRTRSLKTRPSETSRSPLRQELLACEPRSYLPGTHRHIAPINCRRNRVHQVVAQ